MAKDETSKDAPVSSRIAAAAFAAAFFAGIAVAIVYGLAG